MAERRLSAKGEAKSPVDAKRLSKDDVPRSSKAAKRSFSDAFDDALPHADADVSVSGPNPLTGPSKPNCGARLATRTRATGRSDPNGARSRKMSGWMVPKTETLGPVNPASAGPACVPGNL